MEEGDIIQLEYEGRTDDGIFDTTSEAVAREHDIYDEKRTYQPLTVMVGAGRLVAGLEAHLQEAEVGKECEVTLSPDKAYGQRDPKLIKMHSAAEFRRLKLEAYPGAEVEIEGRQGRVALVAGSRIRVDFNHHLAGEELTFKYTVVEKISEPVDRIKALFRMEYPVDEDLEIEIDGQNISLQLPDRCKFDPAWFQAKYRVIAALRKDAEAADIRLIEHYADRSAESTDGQGEDEAAVATDEKADAADDTPEEGTDDGSDDTADDADNDETVEAAAAE